MDISVFARREAIDRLPGGRQPAVLLEGCWPDAESSPSRRSLDEAIDGRFAWIDRRASEIAASVAGDDPLSAAWLNALALRYYLVKLLRPIAFFSEVRPLGRADRVAFCGAASRDADYADLLAQLCRRQGAAFDARWLPSDRRDASAFPPNPWWRRGVGRLARALELPLELASPRPRVVLCGSPRVLDPVCRALLARGCSVWWLYDRFAVRSWLQWQSTGTRQLACDSSLGRENRLRIDVAGPVGIYDG